MSPFSSSECGKSLLLPRTRTGMPASCGLSNKLCSSFLEASIFSESAASTMYLRKETVPGETRPDRKKIQQRQLTQWHWRLCSIFPTWTWSAAGRRCPTPWWSRCPWWFCACWSPPWGSYLRWTGQTKSREIKMCQKKGRLPHSPDFNSPRSRWRRSFFLSTAVRPASAPFPLSRRGSWTSPKGDSTSQSSCWNG